MTVPLDAELLALGSATLFEASGLACDLDPDLRPAWQGAAVCGPALPVRAGVGDNLALHRALEQAADGEVLVVDAAAGRFGYWGEVLAVAAAARGVRGLVIDGGVRDTRRLAELGFPAFSTCIAIRGTAKNDHGTVGEPIDVRGRKVVRGDLVVADADGIVVLPVAEVPRTLDAARERARAERGYLDRLRRGELTLDIYRLPR